MRVQIRPRSSRATVSPCWLLLLLFLLLFLLLLLLSCCCCRCCCCRCCRCRRCRVVVVVVVVVVLTLSRIIKSVVKEQAPVTLEWRNSPGKTQTYRKWSCMGVCRLYIMTTAISVIAPAVDFPFLISVFLNHIFVLVFSYRTLLLLFTSGRYRYGSFIFFMLQSRMHSSTHSSLRRARRRQRSDAPTIPSRTNGSPGGRHGTVLQASLETQEASKMINRRNDRQKMATLVFGRRAYVRMNNMFLEQQHRMR